MDVSILFSENVSLSGDGYNPYTWFGLKIGYRFGNDVADLKAREKTSFRNIISISL